jgi:3-mercaptopyruvate sulfurtransferase SseA
MLKVLDGGVQAWSSAGKPLTVAANRPWSMERQVRVTAGSLVLVFCALGLLASEKFFIGAALIGAGLVFAGVSNTCMMASVLGRMPWNNPEKAKS